MARRRSERTLGERARLFAASWPARPSAPPRRQPTSWTRRGATMRRRRSRELENGADANTKSADGTTALHWAVHNDNVELVERASSRPAPTRTPSTSTARRRSAKRPSSATPRSSSSSWRRGADVERARQGRANAPDDPGARQQRRRGARAARARRRRERTEAWREQTALIWAAAQNQPAMVKLLLEHGADPDARSEPPKWQRQVSGEKRRLFRPFGGAHGAPVRGARRLRRMRASARRRRRGHRSIGLSRHHAADHGARQLSLRPRRATWSRPGASLDVWDWWGRSPLYVAGRHEHAEARRPPDLPSTDETTGAASRGSKSSRRARTRICRSSCCRRCASAARTAAATRC